MKLETVSFKSREWGLALMTAGEIAEASSHFTIGDWHKVQRSWWQQQQHHGRFPIPEGYEAMAIYDRLIICRKLDDATAIEEDYRWLKSLLSQ